MVFFTCNACGASLKKNQVEKHYQYKCPSCEVLSCMDCGLEFYGDAYASHTQCITEAEKYQGSLFKESGKGGAGKRERKQQEWLETVRQIVAASSFNPRITGLLETIAEYPNLPRKKAKFENFVRSSCKIRDQKTLGQLWDVFSAALQQQSTPQQTQAESCPTDDKSSQVHSVSCQEKSDCSSCGLNQFGTSDSKQLREKKQKKKKKQKQDEEGKETVEQNGDVTEDTTAKNGCDSELHTTKPKKKTKVKHKDTELEECTPSGDGVIVGLSDENTSVATSIKKKKRKKKHKHREGDDVDMAKDSNTKKSDCTDAEAHQLQVVSVEEEAQGVDVLAVEELSSRKSHKRKRKEGKTQGSIEDLDSQCSVLSCADDGTLLSSTKRLKADTPAMSKKDPVLCRWTSCPLQDSSFSSPGDLGNHVETCHITPFRDQDVVVCLWEGCKMYNVPSSSHEWLKRHMQREHTKERPYKCLMNGCNMSFNTPEGLQRHILRHFDTPTNGPKQSPKVGRPFQSTGKTSPPLIQMSGDDTPPPAKKLCQMEVSELSSESGGEGRKGLQHSKPVVGQLPLKVRKRRCSFKVRIPRHRVMISPPLVRGPTPFNGAYIHTEVLSHKTMSVIRHTANQIALNDRLHSGTCITVRAKVVGRRRCPISTEDELLIQWTPPLVPDSWVPYSNFQETRVVSFHELSRLELAALASDCFSYNKLQNRKNKRKP